MSGKAATFAETIDQKCANKKTGKTKYKNVKTEIDGIKFDSKRESIRYIDLKMWEKAGEISDLKLQVPFELFPSQKRDGKVIELPCKYIADFTYYRNGELIVEDAKGHKTTEYKIKRKAMLFFHNIKIVEV
jgi:hypothetical protein